MTDEPSEMEESETAFLMRGENGNQLRQSIEELENGKLVHTTIEELSAMIEEGIESGPARPVDFDEIKHKGRRRIEREGL